MLIGNACTDCFLQQEDSSSAETEKVPIKSHLPTFFTGNDAQLMFKVVSGKSVAPAKPQ